MMKKIIQSLLIVILLLIIVSSIIFIFNPFNSRTKIISGIINSYLSQNIKNYESLDNDCKDPENNYDFEGEADNHPLLNEEQEKVLEEYGVDVSRLPSEISSEMEACFVEKLGQERADQIVAGDSPTAMEIIKARSCLGE
jgi:uncharacterized protein YxeA